MTATARRAMVFLAAMGLLAVNAPPLAATELKAGFVDLQAVLAQSKFGQRAQRRQQAKVEKAQQVSIAGKSSWTRRSQPSTGNERP